MKCITATECGEWLRTHRIKGLDDKGEPFVFGDYEVFASAPSEARVRENLAQALVSWIGEFDSLLYWLAAWPFYKDEEMAQLISMRETHGEKRQLIEAPGYIFEPRDGEELVRLVSWCLSFGYDGYLFPSPYKGKMFQTSHENFVWLLSDHSNDFSEAQSIVREHNLTIHRAGR